LGWDSLFDEVESIIFFVAIFKIRSTMYITIINNYEHGLKVNRMVTKRKEASSF
jgi:hypothetical protein